MSFGSSAEASALKQRFVEVRQNAFQFFRWRTWRRLRQKGSFIPVNAFAIHFLIDNVRFSDDGYEFPVVLLPISAIESSHG